MTRKSMAFAEMGPMIVSVHAAQAPTDAEWDAYLQLCRKKMAQERIRTLAVTAGGAPTTKQRAAIRELLRQGPVPAAVVTDVTVVWGIVTALGWFNAGIRAFAFNEGAGIHDALKYLQVEGFVAASVLLNVREMQRELGSR